VSPRPPERPARLDRAFDEARFGHSRTLNLREGLPTAEEAVRRAELWLREQQAQSIEGASDVLVITGRGNGSVDGLGVIRQAIIGLFPTLRRKGVIVDAREHSPGSFVVRVAPLRALVEAPHRSRRDVLPAAVPRETAVLRGLDPETRDQLRLLAHAAVAALGVRLVTESMLGDEMVRQFTRLAAAIPEGPDRERRLDAAIRRALDEYER
jgi:hypothetical protein